MNSGNKARVEKTAFWIPCGSVNTYLARQGLNPSFLPQLARFQELVLLTPPARYADSRFVQQTATLIAGTYSNKLVIVLAPHISSALRADLLHELRQRKSAAAVVDDLDLCRLLNPGGRQNNLVIGLMEIGLEQQRWMTLSPYHAHDGAQVRTEMYVGRALEAKVLATENKYSRLFSGRKLGKSALLKFVEDTYDKSELPSGNLLRVLRIPIVGVQSDAVLASKVLGELRTRLGFEPAAAVDHTAEGLLACLEKYLAERQSESLLVILDEADVFVERQLDDYARLFEECLSFKLRSDAQARSDSHGLPRVRFVFAGYRKTNTFGGAWGNWGDVLRLDPLEADEASVLIAGPLARLGIDAEETAPVIAFRCGYQPAVLLRFGERLLDLLDDRHPDVADRAHVRVTARDVAEVFQHQTVQDEIRTVVRNNFQGNPAGQGVFSATLLSLADLAPGDAIPNAPEKVWRRLRGIIERGDPTLRAAAERIGWLSTSEPTESGLAEVDRHLRDFVERKLLVLANRDDATYRLRFPYHLPVLLVGQAEELKTAIVGLAQGEAARDDDRAGDPVGNQALRDLDAVLRKSVDLGLDYRAAALGTLWPKSITEDWLANRLGYVPKLLSGPGEHRKPDAAVFLEVGPADAAQVLIKRPSNMSPALFVGGADLLRWALASVEDGTPIEVQGQRRLTPHAVDRWFRRVQGFEFNGNEVEEVIRRTGRIPYLISLFDMVLSTVVEGVGVHVSNDQFEHAVRKYERKLDAHVAGLANKGNDATRLTNRERQLACMVAVAAADSEYTARNLMEELSVGWDMGMFDDAWRRAFPGRPCPPGWVDSPDDRRAARVLVELGLLPLPLDQTPAQGPFLMADDPLVTVIATVLAEAETPN